jgi:hypothetical protein
LTRGFGIVLLVASIFLAGCATSQPLDIQQIDNWGIGWALKGAPNRLNSAYPPIVRLMRREGALVKSIAPPRAFLQRHRDVLNSITGVSRDLIEKRFIGSFSVSGLNCAGKAYPVYEGAEPVAIFLVLDVSVIQQATWRWCGDDFKPNTDIIGLKPYLSRELNRILKTDGKSG